MANEANDLNAPAKSTDGIPFWNVNIPKEEWTDHCPDYLSQVDHYDQAQLAVKDDEYQAMSWQEVKVIVQTNRLELFKRYPSELRKYRVYVQKIKDEYGSVMNFILKQRLRWQDLNPKGSPFQYKEDICILFNDWPYGVDRRISHLVVWTKFIFAEDPSTGDLTAKARKEIQDFVDATFHDQTKKDQVVWFKNWSALKSIHAVEHFHVMLYDSDPDFIKNLTGGDTPLARKVAASGGDKIS